MHTAICAFTDKDRAQDAVNELVRAGFAREDIHIEDKRTSEGRDANDAWDGLEHEVAVDRSVLSSFGHFFASLLGRDNPSGHVDTYSDHVRRGSYVVVVDAGDEAGAERARGLLQGLRAGDLNVVHRPQQMPLRDIVGKRQAEEGTAGMVERSREPYEGWNNSTESRPVPHDRAMASNALNPTTGPDLRDPELDRAPGLRYADKDKPL